MKQSSCIKCRCAYVNKQLILIVDIEEVTIKVVQSDSVVGAAYN